MSLESKVKEEMERIVIIPDIHAPYQDQRAVDGVIHFIRQYKPHKIKMLGDLVDFYPLSAFDKDPRRITSLQEEIDTAQKILQQIRKVTSAPITLYEGNHEERLLRYLRANPEISSLEKINTVPALLDLNKYGVVYKKWELVHGVLFKHGNVVRRDSASSAKGEYMSEGTSGVSGHVHRLGSFYLTNRAGQHAWFEMGHLCDESKTEYLKEQVPNWQKGFGVMEYDEKSRLWQMYQIPINNNTFIFQGKVYKC